MASAEPAVSTTRPVPGAAFSAHQLSQPGDVAERAADARASGHHQGDGAAFGVAASPRLPLGSPPPVAAQAHLGRPLAPGLAARFGTRLGADLSAVRLHTCPAAADLADAADAKAFTVGSHVFFGAGQFAPGTRGGDDLLAHELGHTVTAPDHGPVRLHRQPKPKGTVTIGEPTIGGEPMTEPVGPDWRRMEIKATGMDMAALELAATWKAKAPVNFVWMGLSSDFAKLYGPDGKELGPRIKWKEGPKLRFQPGIYSPQKDGSLAAAMIDLTSGAKRMDTDSAGRGQSVLATRELTKKEKADQAAAIEKAKTDGTPPPAEPVAHLDLTAHLSDQAAYEALLAKVTNYALQYFVPTYKQGTGTGKGGGDKPTVYASPIEGRGDGKAANAPPWPVSMDGPRLVPRDSSPTFSSKINWTANGNWSVQSQVISQIGESIHYRWEYFDITQYARQQAKQDPAHARDDPEAKTLQQHIDEFTTSKRGSGTDVTGTAAARREFSREFEDWWKDNRRAAKDMANPHGETQAERMMNSQVNMLALELAPVSVLITTIGAIAHFVAELFAGPRVQQEVNLPKDGIYLIRVITTPAINTDTKGEEIIRPPSVAARVVEVAPMERAVQEVLDEPSAQLSQLDLDITRAEVEGNLAKAEYLRDLKKRYQEQMTASPVDLLKGKLTEKEAELKKFKDDFPTLSAYSREHAVDVLRDQIKLYEANEKDRLDTYAGTTSAEGLSSPVPPVPARVNATLVSEVSGQSYPLMMTVAPEGGTGAQYRMVINDITSLESGGAFRGELADTPRAAFESALKAFGRKASYGRGTIGAYMPVLLGIEPPKKDTPIYVESAPADSALAMKRIDDLVMTLAAVGLFVVSAGTASAVIGAVAAGVRLAQRLKDHKLSLDTGTISDLLGVLGGLGATGALAANLRLSRLGKTFVIMEEAGASEAALARAGEALEKAGTLAKRVEWANEALGYAGLVWGDVVFADEMLKINAQENDPNSGMTHAAARRARSDALNAAIQNNGLFLAGNLLKYRAQAEPGAKAVNEQNTAAKKPTVEAVPGEKPPVTEKPATEKPAAGEKPAAKKPLTKEEKAAQQREAEAAEARRVAEQWGHLPDQRATPKELIDALPEDLRKNARIDETLTGDRVTIDWEPDRGGVGEIDIRISPEASKAMVRLHEPTVRTLQKFQGLWGRVRALWNRLNNRLVGSNRLDPANKPMFDRLADIAKLEGIVKDLGQAAAKLQGDARENAEAQLDSLNKQLEDHATALELGDVTGESGISARGVAKKNLAEYKAQKAIVDANEPGSDAHRKARRKMYELDGGTWTEPVWRKVYEANVERANKANAEVAAERVRLGWSNKEYAFTELGRRLDLADPASKKGAEVKAYSEGTVYNSSGIRDEVAADAKIVKLLKWELTWIFIDCEPSAPLKADLHRAGITIELRTKSERSSRLLDRIPPPATK